MNSMTESISGGFQQVGLYPPCLPACRKSLYSGSSSRWRIDYLTVLPPGSIPK
jgi:hypothetical protein